ncbi:MAG: hypothetical protein ACE5IQ_07770 [Candidatus Methylomirabilales bacterium]
MNSFRISGALAAACLTFACAFLVQAAEFPAPKVGYSADLRMEMRESARATPMIVTGKIYASRKGNERRETVAEGQETITIWRQDKGVAWMLLPKQRLYMEARGGDTEENPERMIQEGRVKFTKVGSDTVNGIRTTKYRMEATHKHGARFVGHRWVTSKNVPVRMEGTMQGRSFRTDYRNIKIGRQNPRLFELPAGYQRIAMPQMPGAPPTGMRGRGEQPQGPPPGGMTKGQAEQLRKQIEELQKMMPKQ